MGQLREEAEELGIDTDNTMKAGALKRKIAEAKAKNAEEERRNTVPKKKEQVRLLKHFRPYGWYRVIGHFNGDEEFVKDQPAPAPFPGVNFEHKLWTGTVVELPEEEAQKLVTHTDDLTVVERDPDTRLPMGKPKVIKRRRPLAEIHKEWATNAVGFEDARA